MITLVLAVLIMIRFFFLFVIMIRLWLQSHFAVIIYEEIMISND